MNDIIKTISYIDNVVDQLDSRAEQLKDLAFTLQYAEYRFWLPCFSPAYQYSLPSVFIVGGIFRGYVRAVDGTQ